ncbi:MAG: hypothetical protein J6Y78_12235 [Paludibacteraceae bacterium]|nr:hypothetical protein [Paludibacteraceae bacterium]
MSKRNFVLGIATLTFSVASFAETPYSMQVWLKNGEQQVYEINQVDSITFGESYQSVYKPLNDWTFPPKYAAPNPLVVTDQEQSFVQTTNDFAMKCYAKIRKMPVEPGSTEPRSLHFFSPVSLNIALGLCANGASAEGAKEITDALGFQSSTALSDMNNFFQKVYNSINSNVDSVDIHTANALWIQNGAAVYDEFLSQAREKYYATVRHLDFLNNSKNALDTINYWAALMTNDRIKSLSIDVNPNTQLVLNNACYFKAKWKFVFEGIGEKNFQGVQSQSQQAQFMEIENKYMKCAETDDYQAVEMDYVSGDFDMKDTTQTSAYSMIVILPKKGHDLDEVLPTLQLNAIPFQKMTCNVIMPKFEMKGNYQLGDVLSELNINDIFTRYPNAIIDPMETLYVSQIAQDYFVKVDEEGTEAAAVTSTVVDSKMMMPEAKFKMECNSPFFFVIRENTTGLLIFVGEYDDVPQGN